MKKVVLFVLINLVCLGSVNSQIRENGSNVSDTEINSSVEVQTIVSGTSETINKPPVKKIVPVTLFDKGVWVNDKSQSVEKNPKEKNVVKTDAVRTKAPVVLVDKGIWVADKNLNVSKTPVKQTATLSEENIDRLSTGNEMIDAYIADYSALHNIDPLLIYAQMYQESGFRIRATSYKGARGLMQLMPATAARFGVKNIYDPKQNIEGGIKYMRWLMDKFNGDEHLALAAYNAGEGAVLKYGNQIPPYEETRRYVKKIIAQYNFNKSRRKTKL